MSNTPFPARNGRHTITSTSTNWTVTPDAQSEIDALLARYTNATPGCAVGIFRNGEVEFARGYGLASLEHSIPITPDSVFYIASVSKQFTAMCIALLAADGLLDMDDDIRSYITLADEIRESVTIRHLLHHVSGLREQFSLLNLAGWRADDVITNQDVLNLVRRQKRLTAPPNTEYQYCNTGYTLLSIIVKKVTHKTMRQYAQERIFGPLGMINTHFHDNHAEIVPNRTSAYETSDDGSYAVSIPMLDIIGDGGLYTTINDMAKWNRNFATPVAGDAALIDAMQTPGTFANGKAMTYAWGLGTSEFGGLPCVSHGGAMAGYRSHYLRLPEIGFSIAIFANHADIQPGVLAKQITRIVLNDRLALTDSSDEDATPSPCEDVKMTDPVALAGSFAETNGDNYLVIEFDGSTAFIQIDQQNLLLHRQEDGVYTQKWGHFVLAPTELDADDKVITLRVRMVHEGNDLVLNRVASLPPVNPEDYVGKYYCDELDTLWEISADRKSDGLTIIIPRHNGHLYKPFAVDRFGHGGLGMGGSISFTREGQAITEFEYLNEKLGSLRFVRLEQSG